MQNFKKSLISIFIFFSLVLPSLSLGAQDPYKGLIPCNNVASNSPDGTTVTPAGECDFNQLMNLINKLIKFVLFDLALPISAILFAYAGFKLITGQTQEDMTTAKNIFTDTVFGLVIALASWLIVRTVLSILGYNGAWIGF